MIGELQRGGPVSACPTLAVDTDASGATPSVTRHGDVDVLDVRTTD